MNVPVTFAYRTTRPPIHSIFIGTHIANDRQEPAKQLAIETSTGGNYEREYVEHQSRHRIALSGS